jgi:hypothetical protein
VAARRRSGTGKQQVTASEYWSEERAVARVSQHLGLDADTTE